MEKEKLFSPPSYVGPLGGAEESADKFCGGLIYSGLLEKLVEQHEEVQASLTSDDAEERKEAFEIDASLNRVWVELMYSFGIES